MLRARSSLRFSMALAEADATLKELRERRPSKSVAEVLTDLNLRFPGY